MDNVKDASAYGVAVVGMPAPKLAVVDTDGRLWLFGQNAYRVNDGKLTYENIAIVIMDGVAKVSLNANIVLALKTNGELWVFEDGFDSALRNHYSSSKLEFIMVMDNMLTPDNEFGALSCKYSSELHAFSCSFLQILLAFSCAA